MSPTQVGHMVGEKLFIAYLAALCCTILSLADMSLVWGSHALAAYSSWGLTMVLEHVDLMFSTVLMFSFDVSFDEAK